MLRGAALNPELAAMGAGKPNVCSEPLLSPAACMYTVGDMSEKAASAAGLTSYVEYPPTHVGTAYCKAVYVAPACAFLCKHGRVDDGYVIV